MVATKTSLFKAFTLGTLALFMVVMAGYFFKELARLEEDPPYACEGNCVPVRFHVKFPKVSKTDVFLAGSFNNWKRADKTLRLNENPDTTYWIEVDLPAGEPIKYRYALGASVGYWEDQHKDRYIRPEAGMQRQDTVKHWGLQQYRNTSFNLYEISSEQTEFFQLFLKDQNFASDTIEGVDSLFAWAEQRWAKESRLYYPAFNFLTSGTYLYLYMTNISEGFVSTELTSCHVQTNYALPAYLRELEMVKASDDPRNSPVLSRGISSLAPVYCYGLSDASWDHLDAVYTQLPEQMNRFMKMEGSVWRKTLEREQDRIATYAVDINFQRSARAGALDEAHAQLAAVLQDTAAANLSLSWQKVRVMTMTRTLLDQHVNRGDIDAAKETLAFIARETTGFFVPDDSLAAWYGRLPATDDSALFEMQLATMGRSVIKGEGDPVQFAGLYTNLTDSTTFDLAALNGKTVVLDFWSTSCPPCIGDIPDFVAFQNQIVNRDDIVFVSVAEDALHLGGYITHESEAGQNKIASRRRTLEGIAKNKGVNYILLYDDPANPISSHFTVDYFPTKYLIDNTGRIVSQIQSVDEVPL
ncbi:MAG: redoxin family protein [Bacteroidota bacterium]